jgi:hypothetical protein
MVPMTRKPSTRRRAVACAPSPPCGVADPLQLLARAKARGVLSDEDHDLAIRLLLRRAGLHPTIITKAPQ